MVSSGAAEVRRRLDDWMKAICERDKITMDPAATNWAGIAVFKRAAAIYRRARLPDPAAGSRTHQVLSCRIGQSERDPLDSGRCDKVP